MLNSIQANFTRRRFFNGLLTIVVASLIAAVVYLMNASLNHSSFFTGYILMGSFLVLTAFGMRKRLAFLPRIGSAQLWMQLHIYVGLVTFVLFGLHIGWKVPNGAFEISLAILYLIVAISGVYGLVITRTYPRRLTSVGGEVVFEAIPQLRAQIANQARTLVLDSADSTDVLARFYLNHLVQYFERPRGWLYWLVPNGQRKRQLVGQIGELDRYLATEQRQVGRQLSGYVEKRDQLDYHYALQSRLKLWLFVHIGFTYSLLLFSLFHLVLAHAFAGGAG